MLLNVYVLNRNVLPCPNIASISKISHGLTQSVSIVSWYITLKQMQTISKLPFPFCVWNVTIQATPRTHDLWITKTLNTNISNSHMLCHKCIHLCCQCTNDQLIKSQRTTRCYYWNKEASLQDIDTDSFMPLKHISTNFRFTDILKFLLLHAKSCYNMYFILLAFFIRHKLWRYLITLENIRNLEIYTEVVVVICCSFVLCMFSGVDA